MERGDRCAWLGMEWSEGFQRCSNTLPSIFSLVGQWAEATLGGRRATVANTRLYQLIRDDYIASRRQVGDALSCCLSCEWQTHALRD